MAGLDTRGLGSGFLQGFQVMSQHQRGQRQDERADQQMAMQQERFDMQKDEVERARDLETIQFTLGKVAQGMEVDEAEIETLKRYPRFWKAFDPATDQSLEQAKAVIDPQSPADMNDPQSIGALNQMFEDQINKGEGGQKRIVGAYPGPDGQSMVFDLEVVGEDGQPYNAPMTEGRGPGGDDDMVMQVPVEKLIEQVQGMRMLRMPMRTPEAQARASQLLKILSGEPDEGTWEQMQGPDGSILQRNTRTGETKSVIGRARSSSGGYYNRPTSTMKEAQWLVDNNIAGNIEEAYDLVRARAGQGTEFGMSQEELDYIGNRVEEVADFRSSTDYRRLNEAERAAVDAEYQNLIQRREELADQMFNRGRGGGGQEQPQPQLGAPQPQTSTQAPQREQGQRPGPQPQQQAQTPDDEASAILKSILPDRF